MKVIWGPAFDPAPCSVLKLQAVLMPDPSFHPCLSPASGLHQITQVIAAALQQEAKQASLAGT